MDKMGQVLQNIQEKAYQSKPMSGAEETQSKTAEKGNYRCSKCKDIETLLVFKSSYKAERPEPEDDPLSDMERFSLDRANEVAVQCSCVEERKRDRLMNNSRITPEFQGKSFANFDTEGKHPLVKDMKDIALAYYKNFDAIKDSRKNSIAFYGQPGSGKTHLLSALCNSFIKKKLLKVVYFPYIEGFNDLRDDFEALNAKLNKMNTADVLFIDDLFKGKLTDWEFKQIMAVVNYRYLNNLPLLISTEHDVDSLCATDEAFGSRIYEMTKDYAVTVKGDKWELNYRLSD